MKRKEIRRRLNKVVAHLTAIEGDKRIMREGLSNRVTQMIEDARASLERFTKPTGPDTSNNMEVPPKKRQGPRDNWSDEFNTRYGKSSISNFSVTMEPAGQEGPSKNKKSVPPAKTKEPRKTRLSPEARKRIGEAQRKRWQVFKANKAKAAKGKKTGTAKSVAA